MVKLIIIVTDINDNVPRFSSSLYQASIPADAKQGYQVLQMSATDLDSGVNSLIFYKITNGNEDGIFSINSDNGLITLGNKSLASAGKDIFTLTVQACDEKDQSKNDEATVVVNVFPPDGPPQYPDPSLSFDETEGIPAGRKIASVAAATTEYVIYEILSGNEDGVIEIDPFSGDLVTAQELDYETSPQYKLHVRARDIKGRSAEVKVTINVLDINDNSPFFIDSVAGLIDRKVESGIQKGEEVTQIEAYDLDNEASMEYKLSDGAEDFLSIDNQGVIRAKRTLGDTIPGKRSTEPLSQLSFNVEAVDGASPPNSVKSPVRLALANYQAGQEALAVRVREDTRVGKTIALVPRYIPGGELSILYPTKTFFTVDKEGRVKLAEKLDFETQATFALTIQEKGSTSTGPIVNDIDLEITVVDVNDNDPKLEMKVRHGRVNGNSRPGVTALKLQVSDADAGPNGLAGYQLATDNTPFGINPLDDSVEVDGLLTRSQYDLEVLPFDYGIPRRQNAPIKVRVDVGQLPPRFIGFHDDGYWLQVPEDAKGGTIIGKIEAVSASGSRMGYRILEGDPGNVFKIAGNGDVRLNVLLDYETQTTEYELLVEAIELIPMGLTSKVKVKISVLNANDHYPVFEKGYYTATIQEDLALGIPILTATAADCDCSQDCSCSPGQLAYSVKDTEYFTVDPDTGVISPARSLDFESKQIHTFKVQVSDTLRNATHVALAYVQLNVTNANDNPPRFKESEYRFGVYEDAEVGVGLGAVVDKDADHDVTSYEIISGSGPFQIDSKTGIISLKQSLPSTPWEYTYIVRGRDPGGNYGDTKVVIYIKDKNDNRPVFEKCEDSTVGENLPAGEFVTQVVATDKDRGKNGEVEYSIVYAAYGFEIDNSTGVLRSTETFDREKKAEYMVVIAAEDGGHGREKYERLLRYCKLKVTVEDVNDNYPYFRIEKYTGSVLWDASVGTSIMTVHAFDSDSGNNRKVEYHLEPDDKFKVSDQGKITTKVSLKPFKGTKIVLKVIASNTEPMTLQNFEDSASSEATIEIFVSDVPPPKFTKEIYTTTVQENELKPIGNL